MTILITYLCIGLLIAWGGAELHARNTNEARHDPIINTLAVIAITLLWPLLLVRSIVKSRGRT
jgi:hypothetical protein